MEDFLAVRIYNAIVGILGILGNGLVCVVICKVSSMQTRTNAFIFHQAVVDFLGSTLILLRNEVPVPDPLPDNVMGWFLCRFWIFNNTIMFVFFVVSTYNLLAVTMERYFAIVHPFKYEAAFSRWPRLKVGLAIATCWIIGITIQSYSLTLFKFQYGKCLSNPPSKAVGIATGIMKYVVPVAVMLFAYIRISAELKRGAARVGPDVSGQAAGMMNSLLKARRNTFKMLLIVFITFMICWTPNQLIFLMFNLGYKLDFSAWYYLLSVAMVATNSCVNPVIYAFKYRQFRNGLQEMFCGKRSRTDASDLGSLTQSTQNHP